MFDTWNNIITDPAGTLPLQLGLIPVALFYSNAVEWFTHKYVLHGLGKNRKSFWSFHWYEHHSNARKNNFLDQDYLQLKFKLNAQTKEILGLALSAILYLPLFFLAPFAFFTLIYCAIRYHYVHRRAHLDLAWAKKHLPWHYDHHMGANQNLNWCVTKPWFDWIMRTRVHYGLDEK